VRIAFFDLDRTLFSVNSGALWLRREFVAGHISFRQAARAGVWLTRYQLGLADLELAIVQAVATLAGTDSRPVKARIEQFYRDELKGCYRPRALEVLERHRRANDRCVLLTASTEYLSRLVVEELSLDGYLCNRLELDDRGFHTGRVLGGACFGRGKLRHAEGYVKDLGATLSDCTFYTDSYSDRSVLYEVGKPVAVNPDVRLYRLARKQGWETVDWGVPGGS